MDTSKRQQRESGIIYITTVVLMCLVAWLSMNYLSTTKLIVERRTRTRHQDLARRIAESGMQLALAELTARQDAGTDGIGTASGLLNRGRFEITLTPPFMGSGRYVVHARGEFADQCAGFGAVVEVGGDGLFGEFAVFARDRIDIGGSFLVDSYDASAGSYASQAVNSTPQGAPYASANGNLGSNGTISISGSADVYGDIILGPTASVVDLSQMLLVQGTVADSEEAHGAPSVTYDPPVPASGELSLGGDATQSFASGSYRFSSLTMASQSILQIEGAVTLYVDGPFDLGALASIQISPGASLTIWHGSGDLSIGGQGIVNPDGLPESCQIFSASTDVVNFSGSSNFYGTVYAPDALFDGVSTADFYGGIVAREARLGGSMDIHLDESLKGSGEALVVQGIWELPLAEVLQLAASSGGGNGG